MEGIKITDDIYQKAEAFTSQRIDTICRITDGSINETYDVALSSGERFILQKMSSIFPPGVMDNLATIQNYAQKAGVVVPEGVLSVGGEKYLVNGAGVWYRALTYIPGKTIHDNISIESAESAGVLVGRFHAALITCNSVFSEAIRHFHDTHYYMDRLVATVAQYATTKKDQSLRPLAESILLQYQSISVDVTKLPQRVIHADLKISNIRFDAKDQAIALIDMDTLMRGSIVTEMGDALRSWCGTAGEDSKTQVFNEKICLAALSSYKKNATGISSEEINAIPEGIALLTLELASRFVVDAYEERYFAQSSRYKNLYEQNKTKAENQLSFLEAFSAKRHLIVV